MECITLCRCVFDLLLRAQCLPAYSYAAAFMPISEAAGFVLIHAPAHHLQNCMVSIMHNVLTINDELAHESITSSVPPDLLLVLTMMLCSEAEKLELP